MIIIIYCRSTLLLLISTNKQVINQVTTTFVLLIQLVGQNDCMITSGALGTPQLNMKR